MSHIYGTDKPSLEEFKHHGVKGMKWGVRQEQRLNRLQRVASGSSSTGDKVKTAYFDMALGASGSRQVNAQIQAAKSLKSASERGEVTAKVLMKYYGTRAVPGIASLTFNKAKK